MATNTMVNDSGGSVTHTKAPMPRLLLLLYSIAISLSCVRLVNSEAAETTSPPIGSAPSVKIGQPARLTSRHVSPLCTNFTLGVDDYQVYSSDWQRLASPMTQFGKYPAGVDCYRVIQAPPNRLVKLQFSNFFEIEESGDCLYDFIEVRDGPFGYSQTLGRFCGTVFPPDIVSTQRFLWLRFHSDDMLESKGFEIIVSFPLRSRASDNLQFVEETQFCMHSIDALAYPSLTVNSNMLSSRYIDYLRGEKKTIDCVIEVVSDERTRFSVLVESIAGLTGHRCDDGFVTIYDGSTATPKTDRFHYCSNTTLTEAYLLTTNHLFVRVVSRTGSLPSFRLSLAAGNPVCDSYYSFDCINSICIPQQLVCNRQPDCPSKLDEVGCDVSELPAVSAIRSPSLGEAATENSPTVGDSSTIIFVVIGACIGIIIIGIVTQILLLWIGRQRKKSNRHNKSKRRRTAASNRHREGDLDTTIETEAETEASILVSRGKPSDSDAQHTCDSLSAEAIRLSLADTAAERSDVYRSQPLTSFNVAPAWSTRTLSVPPSRDIYSPYSIPTATTVTTTSMSNESEPIETTQVGKGKNASISWNSRTSEPPATRMQNESNTGSLRLFVRRNDPNARLDSGRRSMISRSITMPTSAATTSAGAEGDGLTAASPEDADQSIRHPVTIERMPLTPVAFYEV